jgi:hypothetical protein
VCDTTSNHFLSMKNPETKTKLHIVLKSAIWGGLILVAPTAFAMYCYPFSGVPLYFAASIPGDFAYQHFIGHESTNPFDSSFLYESFCVIVNGLLGAILGIFCRFIVFGGKEILSDIKKNHEK